MDTKKLRQKILDLAIHGKLVPQDPNDEPASVLLERIRAEKERLIAEGKIKRSKKSATSDKPHYENVPFEVPEGWCWCQFGEFVDVRDGTHDSPKYVANGIPFVTSKNLKNGEIDFSAVSYISEKDHQNFIKRSKVDVGDILFAMIGSIGNPVKVNIAKEFSIKNVALFKPFVKSTNMDYVLLFLQFVQGNLQKDAKGGMQPFIPLSYFRKDLYIPLPPEKEQETIVSEVEKLLTIVDNIEQSKQDLSTAISQTKNRILDLAIHGKLVPQDPNDEPALELLKRINSKAVASCDNPHYQVPYQVPNNWIWCHLKNICAKIVDGDHNPPAGAKGKTSYMMLSSKNINNDSLVDIDNCRFLTFEDWVICNSRTKLTKGDILLTTVATLGRSCVYDSEIPFCFQRSVTVITTMINNYFLKFLFDSPYYQSLMNDSAKGTAQKGFYLNQLEQSLIPVPPMSEQLRIVSKINELFSQLDMIEKSLQA